MLEWDNLRYMLAIHRRGSMQAAADELGIDTTRLARSPHNTVLEVLAEHGEHDKSVAGEPDRCFQRGYSLIVSLHDRIGDAKSEKCLSIFRVQFKRSLKLPDCIIELVSRMWEGGCFLGCGGR